MILLGLGSCYASVCARAWRDWVAFLKTQILVSLVVAALTAVVTGPVSAGVGERFNVQVAVYAAVIGALVVAPGQLDLDDGPACASQLVDVMERISSSRRSQGSRRATTAGD